MGRILDTIRARAGALGFSTPELIGGMFGDEHPLLQDLKYRPCMPAPDRLMVGDELSVDFHQWVERHVTLLLSREAWSRLNDASACGRREPWAELGHPLLAAATSLNPGQTVSVDGHLAHGTAVLSYREPRVEVSASIGGSSLTLSMPIPDAIVDAMAGRLLVEVVDVPETGVAHIDEAVRLLVVDVGRKDFITEDKVALLLRPADWVAMADPPPEARRWWESAPFRPDLTMIRP